MTDQITKTFGEDVVAQTQSFLQHERGADLSDGSAAQHIANQIQSRAQLAADMLSSFPLPGKDGFFVPLNPANVQQFELVKHALADYVVLIPSSYVDHSTAKPAFYPAVVSEQESNTTGKQSAGLRLHVLKKPYQQRLGYGAAVVLSGAAQSETPTIGKHNRTGMSDGVEPEHFATILSITGNQPQRKSWTAGRHINHDWRVAADTSVTSQMSAALFGAEIPQQTVTIWPEMVARSEVMLFWHRGLIDDQTGLPEHGGRTAALLVVQALGHQALIQRNPKALDSVKELLNK